MRRTPVLLFGSYMWGFQSWNQCSLLQRSTIYRSLTSVEWSARWGIGRILPIFQTQAGWMSISTVVTVMRGVWLGCFVSWSVWVEWLLHLEGRDLGWFIFATPSPGQQPAPCSTLSHFVPLNLNPMILSHQYSQIPSLLALLNELTS